MTRHVKDACVVLAVFLLVTAVALGLIVAFSPHIPTAEDNEEARTVLSYLRSQYEFPAATWSAPGRGRTIVGVYGVVAPKEQERVADLVRNVKGSRGWKPVELRFHEKQVLEDLGDGLTQRGRETKLRTITID